MLSICTGQGLHTDCTQRLEFLGVDDGRIAVQGHCATGVTGAAATRNNGQAKFDACAHNPGHLKLGVRRDHHERHLYTPVCCVRSMRYPGQPAKIDVLYRCFFPQPAPHTLLHFLLMVKFFLKPGDRITAGAEQFERILVAIGAGLDLRQPVTQRTDQLLTSFGVV